MNRNKRSSFRCSVSLRPRWESRAIGHGSTNRGASSGSRELLLEEVEPSRGAWRRWTPDDANDGSISDSAVSGAVGGASAGGAGRRGGGGAKHGQPHIGSKVAALVGFTRKSRSDFADQRHWRG